MKLIYVLISRETEEYYGTFNSKEVAFQKIREKFAERKKMTALEIDIESSKNDECRELCSYTMYNTRDGVVEAVE
jgi:putative aminopeptidase FrvX